jgi:chemotaxis protein CheD
MDYHLNSGEVLFSTEDCLARTILGSCIGVAVFDPVLRIGGLCHYLLPRSPETPCSCRYGDVALPYLFGKFHRAGSERKNLRVWVVGGALLLDSQEVFFVGDRNAEFAEQWLEERGLRVVANETRGYHGRKIAFHTLTGQLALSEISPAESSLNLII